MSQGQDPNTSQPPQQPSPDAGAWSPSGPPTIPVPPVSGPPTQTYPVYPAAPAATYPTPPAGGYPAAPAPGYPNGGYPPAPGYGAPPTYPAPGAYRAPGLGGTTYPSGPPSGPPTAPPGYPPTYPPLGYRAPTPPEQPHHARRTLAGIALIALIAIVLGLTAGVTLDRALQDRNQQAGGNSTTPLGNNGSNSNGSSSSGSDPSTIGPFGSGGYVDPSTNGGTGTGGTGTGSGSGGTGSNGTSGGTAPTDTEANAIAAKVTPGLVNINTQLGYQSAAAAGTGMILTSDGKVLTNNHVVDGSTTIRATVVGTGKTYEAKVVGTAPTLDIALIQLVDATGLPTVAFDTTGKPSIGDPVVAAGNAGGKGGQPSVVSGTVTALDQSITASDENGDNAEQLRELIETNAPIEPGDSGGPLINKDGKVIGINTAASSANQFQSAQSVGYAIPIANALDVIKQIEAGHETDVIHLGLPGIMGVQVDSRQSSAVISGVATRSPAATAGITTGDTITAVDGTAVTTPESLTSALASKNPGDKVSVSWVDQGGTKQTKSVTLMEGPAD